MDTDILTVTTEQKSIKFSAVVLAKNVWLASTSQKKVPTDNVDLTTTTTTAVTTTTTAATSTSEVDLNSSESVTSY